MERNIKEIVIFIFSVQLTMKCILKKYKKSTISLFDDKRRYLINIKVRTWGVIV